MTTITSNKAVSAAVFAFLAPLVAALLAGRAPTLPELYTALGMAVAAAVATYRVPYFRRPRAEAGAASPRGGRRRA